VAIKYKENQQNNLSRYEAQPGARSFRRIFGESEEEVKTPSLSSSSSTTTMIPEETIPQQNSPTPTSTLSFLARNHTLGRNTKKPKTNITKTNSSFVQRIITNDQLAKILMARTSEDTNLFYNCGTSFVWMDAGGHPKVSLLNKRRVNVNEIIMCVCVCDNKKGTFIKDCVCKDLPNLSRCKSIDAWCRSTGCYYWVFFW
jgi:hypothetical protein